ncbi:MAG: FAD-dependent oxidoreductase [Candidatus Riflebacteria bacterium]|nr:FAD-dependent oxidoreductase [Candidatus Riflebacteria bacterium]
MMKKIVIVGGVAGGASAAARARRLSEDSEVILIERGNYVSFANCGLPYHLGGVIKDRDSLLVQTPESLHKRFNIEVRINQEVVSIDRKAKKVKIKVASENREYDQDYDVLILSPGAEPFRPPVPGIDLAGVFTLRTIPDLDKIIDYIKKSSVKHAVVVGAGFIGLEVAENLIHKKISVTLVERDRQVMPPMDLEMTSMLHSHIRFNGVDLKLGSQVSGISRTEKKLTVQFADGKSMETDMVVLSIGVRPETKLAKDSGLQIGERGGILVDENLRTGDPDIYAIGDAAEIFDRVVRTNSVLPLAGPANRQGRIVADKIFSSLESVTYKGNQGTWICKIFDLAAAQTGVSEKYLVQKNIPFSKVYLHPASHAGYYPGAFPMAIKMIFETDSRRIFGAQIVGSDGVDKRIDVFATAIAGKMTVDDLVDLELAYAPPFGSAKDPVNLAGMIAQNILNGKHRPIFVEELDKMQSGSYLLLDVRSPGEAANAKIPGSVNIPVDSLRERISELPKDKEIIIYCQVGLRGYVAARILMQKGFNCRNLIGGYKTWTMYHTEAICEIPVPKQITESCCASASAAPLPVGEMLELDACGMQCPGPLLKMREKMDSLAVGQHLKIYSTDAGFLNDSAAWCSRSGNKLVQAYNDHGRYISVIQKTSVPALAGSGDGVASALNKVNDKNALSMVVFSGDLDKAYAVFIIANGAVAMGMKVTLFFTFWGLNILRKQNPPPVNKGIVEKMFGMMMPMGADSLKLSKMNFAGMGTAMMKQVMSEKNVEPLPNLIAKAQKAGVKMVACTMSMDVMGLTKAELIDDIEEGGVAHYLNSAADASINLFV